MEKTIGFIGCGNIAKSMIGGMMKGGRVQPSQIIASNLSEENLIEVEQLYGIRTTLNNSEVAREADFIFLTVPQSTYATVVEEIKDDIQDDAVVIIVAAGESIRKNEERLGRPLKVVKAMPNTPSLVGEGVTGVAVNDYVTPEDKMEVREVFESFGRMEFVDESLMDVVTAIGGSSPAYVYMFIEALADGAVRHGMSREKAYTIAAQSVLGAAKMVLETGAHPGQLKDDVCSPNGTTIESVALLEEKGIRSAVIEAVRVNIEKSKKVKGE